MTITTISLGAVLSDTTVIDLTTPLSEDTPVLELPPDHGQPWRFAREEISRYDSRGLAYWSNIKLSEHTGTHFDAPVHWPSAQGGTDVAQVPPEKLIAPAVVIDATAAVAGDPDYLLTRADVAAWCERHGPLPEEGWLLYRTGWEEHAGAGFLAGGHTPGIAPDCARWLAQDTPICGIGVETVGTDAGQAAGFDPPFPCHWYLHGAGKYGLTQLRNLGRLPVTGAVLIAAPLPIVGGSGSPARVLALVPGAARTAP
jgi:kynurenine formamidase